MTAKNCCCFDLRTGNIILAWLDILSIFTAFTKNDSHYSRLLIVPFIVGLISLYAIYKVIPMIKGHQTNRFIKNVFFFFGLLATIWIPLAIIDCSSPRYSRFRLCHTLHNNRLGLAWDLAYWWTDSIFSSLSDIIFCHSNW